MAMFIVFMIFRERGLLKRQLIEEASSGVISRAQYHRALSPFTASTARFTGGQGAAPFYQACAELAHKKEQLLKFGDEGGNILAVRSLRSELATLSPAVK